MSRSSSYVFLGFLLALLALLAGLLLGKGALLLNRHEGDVLHLAEIVLRMSQGQWPHLDFMTPIGVLSFAPIAWLLTQGVGIGHAIMGGSLIFAALLLPALWWVSVSRLSPKLAYGFGAIVLLLSTALVHGGAQQVQSISMYYNRWAWAVSFVLIIMSLISAQNRKSQVIDGIILGFGVAFLALSKITFLVAFFPGIFVALLLRRQWLAIGVALLCGGAIVLLISLSAGLDFWSAYLGDIRLVSNSGIRPQPSQPLAFLLIGPPFVVMNLVLVAGIIFLRQAGRSVEGIVLLLLAPGCIYVTYQNWGNDAQWLAVFAIAIFALRPRRELRNVLGWELGRAMTITGLLAVALIAPNAINIGLSTINHARVEPSNYAQVIPGARHGDLAILTSRMYAPERVVNFDLPAADMRALAQQADPTQLDTLFGEPLEACKLHAGLVGVLQFMSREIDALPALQGQTVFTADTFSNLWMFGSTVPLKGGAPWYYGGDAGLKNADYLLVPICPVTPRARTMVLNELAARPDVSFTEVTRNGFFILLKPNG